MEQLNQNPFHTGERIAQQRAGAEDVASWAGGFVREYLPQQHRDFHTSLPFIVIAGADEAGRVWTTIIEGEQGFIQSPDPTSLVIKTEIDPQDPLARRFSEGGDIGGLGIELATRRRNRFNGRIAVSEKGLSIGIRQTFGNCPQYIQAREWVRVTNKDTSHIKRTEHLSATQITQIQKADTLFIGSGHFGADEEISNGFDASHRGGNQGFVRVTNPSHLQIPDYAGNNFFNTIGNIVCNPSVGLLFVDFETGGLLHITGRAKIDWSPQSNHDPKIKRLINVEIDEVIHRSSAVSLRWHAPDTRTQKLQLIRREKETPNITSFYLAAADDKPLKPFTPGQHLPISIQMRGQHGGTMRHYSLSGDATSPTQYRLSIKREPHGTLSRFLHDQLHPGDVISALAPSGDFTIPPGKGPLVLISAGVGQTPMISMLHALAKAARTTWYLHAARNGKNHAFREEVADLVARHRHLQQRIFYSRPTNSDRPGQDFDFKARISAHAILALNNSSETYYMICGPAQFITDIKRGLEQHGIVPDQILTETFGPIGVS